MPHTFHYQIRIFCIILLLISACKNKVDETETDTITENPVDFYISTTDSGIQVQFSNITLKHKDSFELFLNGQPASYNLLSDKLIQIQKDSVDAGKNMLDFIYTQGRVTDTISKSFYNTVKVAYEIVNTSRHNRSYFTQGLLFDETGNLIESTGLNGLSKILFYKKMGDIYRPVDSIVNPFHEFGEGIIVVNGQIVQLLWKNMYLKIYDKVSRKHIRNMDYNREGWGICTDGKTIYTSDGSSRLYMIDINGTSAQVLNTIMVQDEHGPISNINELEYIDGMIFANIWQSPFIYIIDPKTGSVNGKLDFSQLQLKEEQENSEIDVLNGIAYNPSRQTMLITGKYWSHFYEIKLKTNFQPKAK